MFFIVATMKNMGWPGYEAGTECVGAGISLHVRPSVTTGHAHDL